jgi:hypothetical protein
MASPRSRTRAPNDGQRLRMRSSPTRASRVRAAGRLGLTRTRARSTRAAEASGDRCSSPRAAAPAGGATRGPLLPWTRRGSGPDTILRPSGGGSPRTTVACRQSPTGSERHATSGLCCRFAWDPALHPSRVVTAASRRKQQRRQRRARPSRHGSGAWMPVVMASRPPRGRCRVEVGVGQERVERRSSSSAGVTAFRAARSRASRAVLPGTLEPADEACAP